MPFAPECFWAFQGGHLFGRFFKNFSWSPLCTFLENAGFGWPCENCCNLAIRALLEPLYAPKSCPVFALLLQTSYAIMPFSPECFWAFQGGHLFGRFLKNFPWSLFCTFSENACIGWPCENCHNLAIRALLEPPFSPKSCLVFAL